MRFAYADPPYPGHTKRGLYKADPKCAEVDHAELVARLCAEFPDGWALSTGSTNLHEVLPLCPKDVRIGSWVKPFAIFKPGVNPSYSWEPVIFRGGRKRGRDLPTVRDFVSANVMIGTGTAGAKPPEFGLWLFEVLYMQPDDEFVDEYPGSGAMMRYWRAYQHERRLLNGLSSADLAKQLRIAWGGALIVALHLRPLSITKARVEVKRLHRHLPKIVGGLFGSSVYDDGLLVGVGVASEPKARMSRGKCIVEITRIATDGHPNACTRLYAALTRAAAAVGYVRAVTFTRLDEPGTSLKAAGFRDDGVTDEESWNRPARGRNADKSQVRRWVRDLAEPRGSRLQRRRQRAQEARAA